VSLLIDLSLGDRVRLPEIRAMVKEDPNYQNLTKEQEQEMKDEVMELRQVKKVGARPTNQSAALDYRRHLTALNDEVNYDTIIASAPMLIVFL
jgi:hypothetical protein